MATEPEPMLYDLLTELDRLEELREDLLTRDITTMVDLEARIEDLHRTIDQQTGEGDSSFPPTGAES